MAACYFVQLRTNAVGLLSLRQSGTLLLMLVISRPAGREITYQRVRNPWIAQVLHIAHCQGIDFNVMVLQSSWLDNLDKRR